MTQELPPLNSLRFFEAAARLGNLRQVAEELHVTPSAVSHSIHNLETWFGAQLFDRGARGLTLTEPGLSFLPGIASALRLISDATDEAMGYRPPGRLSLTTEPTFASRWLVPRLPHFAASHPHIAITLDTSGRAEARVPDGADLEIRCGPKPRAGVSRIELAPDVLVPVCAPELADTAHAAPEALLHRLPLLRVSNVADDWTFWLAGAGLEVPDKPQDLSFGGVHIALEAARQGLGIAIGRWLLVDDDLRERQLVPLALPRVPALSSYWLIGAGATLERRETRAFRRWLIQQVQRSQSGHIAITSS